MVMQPRVSVVIPSYESGTTIERAIQSVLNQAFKDIEILVIDNGSSDNTRQIIENRSSDDSRIKYYYSESNLGPAGGRNKGIEDSSGEYIAFLDADDAWEAPDKLEKQVEILDRISEVGLVFTDCFSTDMITLEKKLYSSYNKIYTRGMHLQTILANPNFAQLEGNITHQIYSGNFICLSTVIVRKSILVEAGAFQDQLFGTEDIDLWVRLAKRCKFVYWNKATTNYYFQPTSISRLCQKRIRELIKYHTYCKTAEPYQAMQDLVMKNLEYCYKLLILEHARQWQPLQAWRGWMEARRSGVRSVRLLPYALSALLGPIPLLINNRIIRPIRNRINI